MTSVVRYFHLRPYGAVGRGGVTVRVTGNTESPTQVDVQAAFCSKKDMYCKATGRAESAKAPVKVVQLRYLPQELSRLTAQAQSKTKQNYLLGDMSFAMKYFLPKE